jgi:hypothetical protein
MPKNHYDSDSDNYDDCHKKSKKEKKHKKYKDECNCGEECTIAKGEKGERGDKGCKGDKGDKGDRGERGSKGDKGDKGDKGNKGDVGEKGERGDKGERGERGEKGEKGDRGEKGEKGDRGMKGERGEKGEHGEKGDKGDKGDQGDKGDKGCKGDKGERGEKGDTGCKGDTGDKGEKGDMGCKGDKGDMGLTGEKGDKGDPGDKGDQGDKGDRGDKGDVGEKGDKGDDGENVSLNSIFVYSTKKQVVNDVQFYQNIVFENQATGPGINDWSFITDSNNEINEFEALIAGWYLINYRVIADFGQNPNNQAMKASVVLLLNNSEISGSMTMVNDEAKEAIGINNSLLVQMGANDKLTILFWGSDVQINVGTNGNNIGKLPNSNNKPTEASATMTITRVA